MPVYRAQVVIPYLTNLPSDVITNTFHFFDGFSGVATVAAIWTPRLADFYEAVYNAGAGVASYTAFDAAWHVNWYNLDDPAPRVPLTVPLGATIVNRDLTVIPSEVACVLSFQAAAVSGTPQARRRGRIYLGGLTNSWLQNGGVLGPPTWDGGVPVLVGNAAETHLLLPGAGVDRWVVWSPTDQAAYPITNGWVDNTPDTQRRRGVEPSQRIIWP